MATAFIHYINKCLFVLLTHMNDDWKSRGALRGVLTLCVLMKSATSRLHKKGSLSHHHNSPLREKIVSESSSEDDDPGESMSKKLTAVQEAIRATQIRITDIEAGIEHRMDGVDAKITYLENNPEQVASVLPTWKREVVEETREFIEKSVQ